MALAVLAVAAPAVLAPEPAEAAQLAELQSRRHERRPGGLEERAAPADGSRLPASGSVGAGWRETAPVRHAARHCWPAVGRAPHQVLVPAHTARGRRPVDEILGAPDEGAARKVVHLLLHVRPGLACVVPGAV